MSAPAALITGGTSGIGKATAELLHTRGYRVTLFDINVKGNFFTLQKALPLISEGASIVFTVGAGEGMGAAMTAAMGALLPLVRSLALELAPRRIRVNAISPGVINTSAYSKMGISQETIDS